MHVDRAGHARQARVRNVATGCDIRFLGFVFEQHMEASGASLRGVFVSFPLKLGMSQASRFTITLALVRRLRHPPHSSLNARSRLSVRGFMK